MKSQFRPVSVLFGLDWNSSLKQGPTDGLLDYDRKNCLHIGFDYSCMSDVENQYVFAVLAWMALTFGRKGKDGHPAIIYDGQIRWPVVVGERQLDMPSAPFCCDRFGWFPWRWEMMAKKKGGKIAGVRWDVFATKCIDMNVKKATRIIHAELERLDKEWKRKNQEP
jgi:hypothetical protein